jgi:hypothetical protein
MCFAVLENFGYRQLTLVMRLWGLGDFVFETGGWGKMEHKDLRSLGRRAS